MNGYQIQDVVGRLTELSIFFKGCYINSNIPKSFFNLRSGFFIVNTLPRHSKQTMGHWVLFLVKENILYFFDSFGFKPKLYGYNIKFFFENFPNHKEVVFDYPIQDKKSLYCGIYTIFFSYLLFIKNISTRMIKRKKLFSRICLERNDSYVKKFVFSKLKIKHSCNIDLCPGIIFETTCNRECICIN